MRQTIIAGAALSAAILSGVAGCQRGQVDPAPSPVADSAGASVRLAAPPVEYLLTDLGLTPTPTSGSEPSLRFDEANQRVSGFSGCNRFNAAFTREGDRVKFGPLGMTRMACADPTVSQLELRFTQALSQVTRVVPSGENAILLQNDAGDTLMRLRRR